MPSHDKRHPVQSLGQITPRKCLVSSCLSLFDEAHTQALFMLSCWFCSWTLRTSTKAVVGTSDILRMSPLMRVMVLQQLIVGHYMRLNIFPLYLDHAYILSIALSSFLNPVSHSQQPVWVNIHLHFKESLYMQWTAWNTASVNWKTLFLLSELSLSTFSWCQQYTDYKVLFSSTICQRAP